MLSFCEECTPASCTHTECVAARAAAAARAALPVVSVDDIVLVMPVERRRVSVRRGGR